jgi:hypothetical protein
MNDDELLRQPFGTHAAKFREILTWLIDNSEEIRNYLNDESEPVAERDQLQAMMRQAITVAERVKQLQLQLMHPEDS